jgi:ATP-dependent RNA circularization protein (DNA/RNA ligase family)
MIEYNKIDTVYERDVDGTKKLVEGKYRSKAVEFLADCKWIFTEKIDGTNIRIHWDGHKVEFGGRTDRASIPTHLLSKLIDIFHNNETEELFEQTFGEKEVILFGEGYGIKIQNGANYRPDVGFILFDVMVNGHYLDRENVEGIAQAFGLDVVPIVLRGTIEEAVAFVKSAPNSTIGTAKMEGLVGRPSVEMYESGGKRLIVKIKVCDFKEEK